MTIQRTENKHIRDEIMMFAHALERQMQYNEKRGKGDEWKKADPKLLFKRLNDEVKELKYELQFTEPEEQKVRHESCDVGCIAFFIWYRSLLNVAAGIVSNSDMFGVNR
jgi:hypothetical protein